MCESDVGVISQSPTRICQVLSFNRCLTFAKMILIHKNVKQPGLMVKCAGELLVLVVFLGVYNAKNQFPILSMEQSASALFMLPSVGK